MFGQSSNQFHTNNSLNKSLFWKYSLLQLISTYGKVIFRLDFVNELNKASAEDKYSFKNSVIFSIMDLSSAFHPMLLNEESSEFTIFTFPSFGTASI